MTPEQIEAKRSAIQAAIALVEGMSQHWMEERWKAANDLCDLALQSLSQEAVRDEADAGVFAAGRMLGFTMGLEEATKVCERMASKWDDPTDLSPYTLQKAAEVIRALKREPNAAAEPHEYVDAATGAIEEHGPAPAAPDVASMVKRLEGRASGLDGGIYLYKADAALMRQAAAILSRFGQIIRCAERRKDCWPCLTCGATQPLECKVHE